MDYFVYILQCGDGSLYIGHAEDLDLRLERHNRGEGAAFTKARLPVALAYSEKRSSRDAAMARERQLKRWTRPKKEALIAGDFALLKQL